MVRNLVSDLLGEFFVKVFKTQLARPAEILLVMVGAHRERMVNEPLLCLFWRVSHKHTTVNPWCSSPH
jgi:hypothetical protein